MHTWILQQLCLFVCIGAPSSCVLIYSNTMTTKSPFHSVPRDALKLNVPPLIRPSSPPHPPRRIEISKLPGNCPPLPFVFAHKQNLAALENKADNGGGGVTGWKLGEVFFLCVYVCLQKFSLERWFTFCNNINKCQL